MPRKGTPAKQEEAHDMLMKYAKMVSQQFGIKACIYNLIFTAAGMSTPLHFCQANLRGLMNNANICGINIGMLH